jgi:hypothetical protein
VCIDEQYIKEENIKMSLMLMKMKMFVDGGNGLGED